MSTLDEIRRIAHETSAEFVLQHLSAAQLFDTADALHQFVAHNLLAQCPEGLFMELGVFQGATLQLWADNKPAHAVDGTVYGFDAFLGLRDTWSQVGLGLGSFDLGGKSPSIIGASLVQGWVEDTLAVFLNARPNVPVGFVHFDLDVYPPTAYCLQALKSRFVSGTLLLFDELIGYPGWQLHEYRALCEILNHEDFDFIGFANEQALLRIR